MTAYPNAAPALPPARTAFRQDAPEMLRLALRDWMPMSGGLSLESLFDRLEGRA